MEIKRGRGRPKGSLGKPKIQTSRQEQTIPLDIKEVKRQIRLLRKIKKDTHKRSEERRDLSRRIRELRKQLIPIFKETDPEKEKLIQLILEKRPEYIRLEMNLTKFSLEQLQKHWNMIQDKARLI